MSTYEKQSERIGRQIKELQTRVLISVNDEINHKIIIKQVFDAVGPPWRHTGWHAKWQTRSQIIEETK